MNELQNYVNAIAQDIFNLYDGLDLAEDEREEMEEAGEPVYLYDYFNDALDIEYSSAVTGISGA